MPPKMQKDAEPIDSPPPEEENQLPQEEEEVPEIEEILPQSADNSSASDEGGHQKSATKKRGPGRPPNLTKETKETGKAKRQRIAATKHGESRERQTKLSTPGASGSGFTKYVFISYVLLCFVNIFYLHTV